jgi:hypothetical protein
MLIFNALVKTANTHLFFGASFGRLGKFSYLRVALEKKRAPQGALFRIFRDCLQKRFQYSVATHSAKK